MPRATHHQRLDTDSFGLAGSVGPRLCGIDTQDLSRSIGLDRAGKSTCSGVQSHPCTPSCWASSREQYPPHSGRRLSLTARPDNAPGLWVDVGTTLSVPRCPSRYLDREALIVLCRLRCTKVHEEVLGTEYRDQKCILYFHRTGVHFFLLADSWTRCASTSVPSVGPVSDLDRSHWLPQHGDFRGKWGQRDVVYYPLPSSVVLVHCKT